MLRAQDRCLFGRGYFDDAPSTCLVRCGLPDEALRTILRGNALRRVP